MLRRSSSAWLASGVSGWLLMAMRRATSPWSVSMMSLVVSRCSLGFAEKIAEGTVGFGGGFAVLDGSADQRGGVCGLGVGGWG